MGWGLDTRGCSDDKTKVYLTLDTRNIPNIFVQSLKFVCSFYMLVCFIEIFLILLKKNMNDKQYLSVLYLLAGKSVSER